MRIKNKKINGINDILKIDFTNSGLKKEAVKAKSKIQMNYRTDALNEAGLEDGVCSGCKKYLAKANLSRHTQFCPYYLQLHGKCRESVKLSNEMLYKVDTKCRPSTSSCTNLLTIL